MSNPPLLPLHPESSLVASERDQCRRISPEILEMSLLAGQKDSRNTRPDDTILDGHHRIKILQSRGVNVDALPRENQELELGAQSNLTQARGLLFISLPTEDRGVPPSGDDASFSVAKIEEMLRQGENVALHCRPGIGRLGMIAAAGLV